jgi:hypothetical protein
LTTKFNFSSLFLLIKEVIKLVTNEQINKQFHERIQENHIAREKVKKVASDSAESYTAYKKVLGTTIAKLLSGEFSFELDGVTITKASQTNAKMIAEAICAEQLFQKEHNERQMVATRANLQGLGVEISALQTLRKGFLEQGM